MAENRRRPSGTWAMPARTKSAGVAWIIVLPSTAMPPAVTGSSPEMQRIRVVLPAPFEPIDADQFARADLERDVPQHLHVAVAGLQVRDRKLGRGHGHDAPPGLAAAYFEPR